VQAVAGFTETVLFTQLARKKIALAISRRLRSVSASNSLGELRINRSPVVYWYPTVRVPGSGAQYHSCAEINPRKVKSGKQDGVANG
jgi:hypothetical protein